MSAKYTLGAYLRRGRERSGLSVEAVSAGSRIVPRLVDALEADRQDLLPAPVYVRGFIRAYCDQVGADLEEALHLYDTQAIPDPSLTVRPATPSPGPVPIPSRWRRVAGGSLLVAVLGVVGIVLLARRQPDAVAGRGAGSTMTAAARSTEPAVPTVPSSGSASGSAPGLAAPAAAVAPAPSAAPAVPTSAAPRAPVERVLLIRAVDTTWVRVTPDGAPPTEETLSPGTVREWHSAGGFHVTVGNAGGVELELDGQVLPPLGKPGQVVRETIPGVARP